VIRRRYVSTAERADLLQLYDATAEGPIASPSYNVASTQDVNLILECTKKTDRNDGDGIHDRVAKVLD
jgi:hypothetical protein